MSPKYNNCKIRVVAITGGVNVPSRRFRIHALAPFLSKKNIVLTELCPTISKYPPVNRMLRPLWLSAALIERATFLYRARGYNAVILQREMISTLPTLEKLLPKPRILDVDDAIFLHRNGKAAQYIATACSLVVCGNLYLADVFSQWNSNVVVIPTGVDTEKLRPIANRNYASAPSVIGWIGTSGNYPHLESIEPALKKILSCYPNTRLQIISDRYPSFLQHLDRHLSFKQWQPGIENDLLPYFTIGIMPLTDDKWTRGKCSLKLLQYMAAGIPVVVSPVGMNAEILASSSVGLAAQTNKQWLESISALLQSPTTAKRMGANGRQLVEKKYSLAVVSLKWQDVLHREVLKKWSHEC